MARSNKISAAAKRFAKNAARTFATSGILDAAYVEHGLAGRLFKQLDDAADECHRIATLPFDSSLQQRMQ
jgi:hypothetical protein